MEENGKDRRNRIKRESGEKKKIYGYFFKVDLSLLIKNHRLHSATLC